MGAAGPDPACPASNLLMGYRWAEKKDAMGPPREGDPLAGISRDARPKARRVPKATCLLSTDEAPLVVDGDDPETMSQGWRHRVGCAKLKWNRPMMRQFRHFNRRLIRLVLGNALPTVLTYDQWEGTRDCYSPRRKLQLRRAYCVHRGDWRIVAADPTHLQNKVFVKREAYMEYKHARIISSRTDVFKTLTGPLFHRVEEMVFNLPYFIKHVPVDQRPAYIEKFLGGANILGTNDFSSFESLIYGRLMESAELELYRWCWRDQDPDMVRFITRTLRDPQSQTNRMGFKAHLFGRQSGDMCTSVGNGWTNFAIMSFASWKSGWTRWGEPVRGLFEGDDSLFECKSGDSAVKEVMEGLGMRAKLQSGVGAGRMGFLSTCWAGDLVPVRDARKPLVCVPWILQVEHRRNVLRQFLRAKALSLGFEMAGCPVLSSFALRLIESTEGAYAKYDPHDAWWDRVTMGMSYGESTVSEELLARLRAPIPMERRVFYARQFGIPVDAQLHLEKTFHTEEEVKIRHDPVVAALLGPTYALHAREFSVRWSRDNHPN